MHREAAHESPVHCAVPGDRVLGHVPHLPSCIHPNNNPRVGTVAPTVQMRKLRPRALKTLAQGLASRKWPWGGQTQEAWPPGPHSSLPPTLPLGPPELAVAERLPPSPLSGP